MRERGDLVVCNTLENQEKLLEFLNKLQKKYNLSQIIISIVKTASWEYEVYWINYDLETEEDRLL